MNREIGLCSGITERITVVQGGYGMRFRLVDCGWDREIDEALHLSSSSLRIVCPFIKKRAAERLLKLGDFKQLQVITRFNLADFAEGVSDPSALRILMDEGAEIRGIRNLHAKLYLFGSARTVITSANLTTAALTRNHELGFVSDDPAIVGQCEEYFNNLWGRAGGDLSEERLDKWEKMIRDCLSGGVRRKSTVGLGDEGVDIGIEVELALPPGVEDADQGFVKFIGGSESRANRTLSVLEDLRESNCHLVCGFPKGKRPRRVNDGALMFMGRLVQDPNDILIYGRAIGMRHEKGRDDATDREAITHSWKARYPHYIRVHHPEFVAGTISNGVSLNEMMETLKSDSFMPTQCNAGKGKGNTNPRRAYRQQAAIELSAQGIAWLNDRLQRAFLKCGMLSSKVFESLK